MGKTEVQSRDGTHPSQQVDGTARERARGIWSQILPPTHHRSAVSFGLLFIHRCCPDPEVIRGLSGRDPEFLKPTLYQVTGNAGTAEICRGF